MTNPPKPKPPEHRATLQVADAAIHLILTLSEIDGKPVLFVDTPDEESIPRVIVNDWPMVPGQGYE